MTFQSSDFNKDEKVDYVVVVVNDRNEEQIVAQGETGSLSYGGTLSFDRLDWSRRQESNL